MTGSADSSFCRAVRACAAFTAATPLFLLRRVKAHLRIAPTPRTRNRPTEARPESSRPQSFRQFMSARTIVVAGIEYMRPRHAARAVQLAPDHISRLARAELIAGQVVGGLWFVDLQPLKQFM